MTTQLLARGRYAKEFCLSDEFDRKREQLRRRDFAHIKNHELLQELLEDKTSYGETYFVPSREHMSVALRFHSSSDFSQQGQQLLDEQAERRSAVTIKVEETVVIQRPREEVFASVANLDNWGWLRPFGLVRVQET